MEPRKEQQHMDKNFVVKDKSIANKILNQMELSEPTLKIQSSGLDINDTNKSLSFSLSEFVKENKEKIDKITSKNPSISKDDEWRDEDFWDEHDNKKEECIVLTSDYTNKDYLNDVSLVMNNPEISDRFKLILMSQLNQKACTGELDFPIIFDLPNYTDIVLYD